MPCFLLLTLSLSWFLSEQRNGKHQEETDLNGARFETIYSLFHCLVWHRFPPWSDILIRVLLNDHCYRICRKYPDRKP